MANTNDCRSVGRDPFEPPSFTRGPWGKNDSGDPCSDIKGDTPGPAGTGADRAQQLAVEPGLSFALDPSKYSLLDSNLVLAGFDMSPAAGQSIAEDKAPDNAAALKILIAAQDDVMKDAGLAPNESEETDAKGTKTKTIATHCSEATFRVAKKTGVVWDGILGDKSGNFLANTMIANLEKQAAAKDGSYKVVDEDEAQRLANQGVTVFATQSKPGGHGHIATIRPEGVSGDSPAKPYKKPLLANVGRSVKVTGYLGAKGKYFGEFLVEPPNKPVVFYAPKK